MSRQSKSRVLLTTVAQCEAVPRNSQLPPATGLAKLYRQILFALHISPAKEWSLMSRYLEDPLNGIKQTSKRKASARSNLMGALTAPKMSFRTFLRGCRLLRMEGIKITVEPIMPGGFSTSHTIVIPLNDPDQAGNWLDDEDPVETQQPLHTSLDDDEDEE